MARVICTQIQFDPAVLYKSVLMDTPVYHKVVVS